MARLPYLPRPGHSHIETLVRKRKRATAKAKARAAGGRVGLLEVVLSRSPSARRPTARSSRIIARTAIRGADPAEGRPHHVAWSRAG